MRIAYIINSVEGGGAASPVPAVTGVMRDSGAQVRLFALTRRDGLALPAIQASGLDPKVRNGSENDHLRALDWLIKEIRSWGATHIWTSLTRATLLGQIAGMRLGLPVVSWQHAAYLKPWNRRLLRLMQNRSAFWIADSRAVEQLTADRLAVPPDRLMLWPIFAADSTAPRAESWRPGRTIEIGSLGRLHPVKGYDILIAALTRLQANGFCPPAPLRISIAGEGAERQALEAMIQKAGLGTMNLIGFHARPREFLASLHLYVQPSRSEGLCIAAHEALQAGLPAIVSSVGELPWTMAEGEMGLIVPPADPEALSAAMANLLRQPERLSSMGETARVTVLNRFSAANFHAAGQSIIERLFQASAAHEW